ncbi:MAG: SRPBCC family protein, partial [Armatimonadaceae bacterium]
MPTVMGSVHIAAPRERVLEIARDNARFPEFMADVASVTVVETSPDALRVVSDWVAIVPKFGNKVRWREEDLWDLD